jgi:hypothetical protein
MAELIFATVVKDRPHELIKVVRTHAPFVDRSLIVLHGSCKESEDFLESEECKRLNIEWFVIDVPYHPPTLRNAYLEKLPVGSWCIHMDCDEFLEEPGCYQLRSMVEAAEKQNVNRVAFNAHDIRVGFNGEIWDNKSNYYNPVLFKVFPGIEWSGETHGGIHTPGVAPKIAQIPYRYFHIKTTASEFLRGCKNYWSTGEVAQNNIEVPEWKEFKALCTAHGFSTFDDIYVAMVKGNLYEDLKQWFILQRNNENSEARSWFVVYFGLMHPEENTFLAGNRDLPYDKDRKAHNGEMTY